VREFCGANGQQHDECYAATRNIAAHDIAAYNEHDVIAMVHTVLQKQKNLIFCFFHFLLNSDSFKNLRSRSLYAREREKKKPLQDTSLPHLVSFFPTFLILALLAASRSVITQAPFDNSNNNNNNNTSSKRNPRTQSQEKFVAFNIK